MTTQADSASFDSSGEREQRRQLRQQLRQLRRAIPADARRQYAERIATHLLRAGLFTRNRRIGIYLAIPEEISTLPCIRSARQQHCQLYVPYITHLQQRRMAFLPLAAGIRLRQHRWGMAEPLITAPPHPADPRMLDAILMPLVGFDEQGYRLGMGAGFYDRLLARRIRDASIKRPLLIGIAFARQRVACLPHSKHDVPMDAVVTEQGFHRFRRRS
jgi:5-formyltetrahydrofolate cyclo-ligase